MVSEKGTLWNRDGNSGRLWNMKEKNDHREPGAGPGVAVGVNENAVCDACGKFGAFHFGDRALCQDCYQGCGSCCSESEKDDMEANFGTNKSLSDNERENTK